MAEDTAPSVGSALEHDHREIDDELAAFAAGLGQGRVAADRFTAGATALRHHIWVEEEHHFPPLRAAGLIGPILVMLREHGEIWDALDAIDEHLASGSDAEAIGPVFARLESVLEAHNMKEERILYPSGDQILDADTSAGIMAALTQQSRPEGWACEMAGRS